MDDRIKYISGFKYQLKEDYTIITDIIGYDIKTDYIELNIKGILLIKKGYAWDGPSGPTIDTKTFMRGSLVHDALYQLMRLSLIPESYRKYSDWLLQLICIQDGMSELRAFYVYKAVRWFGAGNASSKNKKQIKVAP